MTIDLVADKVRVTGPKVDGGYSVQFDCGEDMQTQVAKCLCLPQQTMIKLTLEMED